MIIIEIVAEIFGAIVEAFASRFGKNRSKRH